MAGTQRGRAVGCAVRWEFPSGCKLAVSQCCWQHGPGGPWGTGYGVVWFAAMLQEARFKMKYRVITCSFNKPFC